MSFESQNIGVLGAKLEALTDAHRAAIVSLDALKTKLMEPPDGLFMQVKELSTASAELSEAVKETKTNIDKLIDICTKHESRATLLENWAEVHETRDNELRKSVTSLATSIKPLAKDYDRRMGIRKWTDKIIWAILALLIAGSASTIKAVFIDHDHDSDEEKMNRIEKLLEKAADMTNRSSDRMSPPPPQSIASTPDVKPERPSDPDLVLDEEESDPDLVLDTIIVEDESQMVAPE